MMAQTINEKLPAINMRGQPKPAGKVSYEEYLEWVDEDTHAEWVNGEIEMTSPASIKHQEMLGFLYELVINFVRRHKLGRVLLPSQMKLRDGGPGREPDLLFIAKANNNRVLFTRLQGPADLVVEIISPESITRDRETKFAEYAAGGVKEYWLIDAINDQAEFYLLNENNQYRLQPIDGEGRYHSSLLNGFWLKVDWLWQNSAELADFVPEALRELGLAN